MPNETELPPDLADWWGRSGRREAPHTVAECGWTGGACRVFRVRSRGETRYLKQHPDHRSYAQELHAYREWSGAFDRVPRVVEHDRDLRLLVLSSVHGEPASTIQAPSRTREEWHREAGRQLARLHALPYEDDDPLPIGAALPRRVAGWRRRGNSVIDPKLAEQVSSFVADRVDLFAGESRVPCHLDYDERNWLVHGATSIGVIDFEHARADHWLADLVRLETGVWVENHGDVFRDAFLDGYGRALGAADRARLEVLVAVWSLATVVWARERNQTDFEALGQRGLERVLGV